MERRQQNEVRQKIGAPISGRQLWDRKGIPPGTQMLATHSYKKKPDGPVGNELDVKEGDTLVYLMKHDDNAHWWLAEDERNRWDT